MSGIHFLTCLQISVTLFPQSEDRIIIFGQVYLKFWIYRNGYIESTIKVYAFIR
jgi:hypothetical protein